MILLGLSCWEDMQIQSIAAECHQWLVLTCTNGILDPLYDLIMYQGFDDNYDYNDFGDEAQAIYDDIYYSNCE